MFWRGGWDKGKVDIIKMINKEKMYYMNKDKSDVEIMMGLLLHRKWGKGIVYAKEIEGLGREHKRNLVYYVNKDLMKPTTDISKYYSTMKESKELLGEEQYREILNALGIENAASAAKTKKERDLVLSALRESLEVKEKEPSGQMIRCPNTGMPDDPESWDEMTPEYCSRCDKKDGCPAFE